MAARAPARGLTDFERLVESASAAAGAAVVVGAAARKYWTGREIRQQAAFRAAVSQIVREQTAELLTRQAELLSKQRRQLDRQDRVLAELTRTVDQIKGQRQ